MKTGVLIEDYGNTGIGIVGEYGFRPITNISNFEEFNQALSPEMFLGRTLNNLLNPYHVKKQAKKFDKVLFTAQDQLGVNPDNLDAEVIVYVHDIFPATTCYESAEKDYGIVKLIGDHLLNSIYYRTVKNLNNADKILVPSEWIKEKVMARTNMDNVEVVYQGVDHLPDPKGFDSDRDIDLLYFGDIHHERKNPDHVKDVFDKAKGLTTAYMNHSHHDVDVDKKFIDVTDSKVAKVLSRSKFLLIPSKVEGLGRTPLEAQRYGCIPLVKRDELYYDLCKEVIGTEGKEWASYETVEELKQIINEDDFNRSNINNSKKYRWENFQEEIKEAVT